MPRNPAGVYTLPNPPVVPDTTITSADENTTRDDIAVELTNSLDRQGRGGMLAPFRIADGVLAAPGLAFLNDPDNGLYRIGADNWALAAGGTKIIELSPAGALIFGTMAFQSFVRLQDGTAALPSLSFINDTGSGMYRLGPNDWALAVAGVKMLEITPSGVGVAGALTVVNSILTNSDLNVYSATPLLRFLDTSVADTGFFIFCDGGIFRIAKATDAGANDGDLLIIDRASGKVGIGLGTQVAGSSLALLTIKHPAGGALQLFHGGIPGGAILIGNGGGGLSIYTYSGALGAEAYFEQVRIEHAVAPAHKVTLAGGAPPFIGVSGGGTLGVTADIFSTGQTIILNSGSFRLTRGDVFSGSYTANDVLLINQGTGELGFWVGANIRGRFTSQGYFKASDQAGTYAGLASAFHELNSSQSNLTVYVLNTAGIGAAGFLVNMASDNGNDYYLRGYSGLAGADRMYIFTNGNIVNLNNSYGAMSDAAYKQIITPAGSQWDDVKALAGAMKKYYLADDVAGDQKQQMLGLVAQDVAKISPKLVSVNKIKGKIDKDGKVLEGDKVLLSLQYSVLHLKGFKALGEAMERVERLEAALTKAGITYH